MKVLTALYNHPGSSGADVCKLSSLPSGTVYPILGRLESAGWLNSQWENIDPRAAGRPRRRFYFLSAGGAAEAKRGASEAASIYASFAS
ncbi:helix-turn-helix transcriptional regulator [Porphyrobacter sp. HT-58-2]|uniref:helix-turn-helix transcriptional regulator n=1 Tax=Porphyrobacter sp. HT-58-2 TaxID=2023229 RepID=UPI003FA735E3